MSELSELTRFRDIADHVDWSPEEQIAILLNYILRQDDDAGFLDYLREELREDGWLEYGN